MAQPSKINWTQMTWNPIVGCTKVSPGCKNCYAERQHVRCDAQWEGRAKKGTQKANHTGGRNDANQPSTTLMVKHQRVITQRSTAILCQSGQNPYAGGFNNVTCIPDRLNQPKSIKKPSLIFVNSMADYLHSDVPDEFNDEIFQVVRECPKHQFQFLTKRSQRMAEYFATRSVPDNAWIGVSVEDKRYGLPRVDDLQKVNAKTRFLSIEPLLEDLGEFDLTGINWVIVGGESVAKKFAARRMMPEWVDSIQRQCHAQGVAFFFKQWGNWHPDGTWSRNKDFNLLHGREWNEMPTIA